jgi:peptidoglycan/xylan/chitin deacetylase (PgdA/CDA1 family)
MSKIGMKTYWVKTPTWLRKLFPRELIWEMPKDDNTVYITFDDGPNPNTTSIILEQLRQYNAKATFFCVGNNVYKCPELYQQLLEEGHVTGNHTFDHKNGMKMHADAYLADINKAAQYIDSRLFRPPYGRMRWPQVRRLLAGDPSWKIYMWNVLSADFDRNITPERCLQNVIKHVQPGSIVIFHDSDKASERMRYALPRVLAYCQEQGWAMKVLPR